MSFRRQIPPLSYTVQNILISMSTVISSMLSLALTTLILPLSILRTFLPIESKLGHQRKIVLVFGASRGIGYNVVRQYSGEEGTKIIAVSKTMDNLQKMVSELGKTPAEVILESLDLSGSSATISKRVEEWDQKHGPITHLYAISGISNHLDDDKEWDLDVTVEMIKVNVMGIVALVLTIFERMKTRKSGKICIVGSVAGLFNPANMISYASTKSFINTFGSSLRILGLPHNVEVVTVAPGFIDTRMTEKMRGQGSTVPAMEFASAEGMARKMKIGLEYGGVGMISWPIRQSIMMFALQGVNPICADLGRYLSTKSGMAGKKIT